MTLFGTSAKYIDAVAKAGLVADARRTGWTPCARSPRPARRSRRRASTSSTTASSATSTSRRSPAAPTSSDSSPAGIPTARSGAARFRRARSAMKVEVFDEAGRPVRESEGRARLHDAVSVDAGRFLERPRRPQVSRRVLRAISRRLASRRLRRADRARRPDHLRPLGRGPQPRRRAHRHGGDLPAGRAARRDRREPRHRPAVGRR